MDQADTLRDLLATKKGKGVRVVAITSGKGGVGKTNVSSNVAYLAAASGERVLIVDADLGLANVEILYGITPRYHLGHLLDGTATMQQVLASGPNGIRILSAGSGLRGLTQLDDAQRLRLMTALDSIEDDFDLVLFDTGAGIGDNVVFFCGGAQEALLVVTAEPTSLTDAYASVKVLSLEGGVEQFNVVVNMAPSDQAAREIFDKLCAITRRFLKARLKFLGSVPRDENIHRAVMAQQPISKMFPQSPATRALTGITARLLGEPPPTGATGGLKFLWQRILRESSSAA